jgi:hypothetical protein
LGLKTDSSIHFASVTVSMILSFIVIGVMWELFRRLEFLQNIDSY